MDKRVVLQPQRECGDLSASQLQFRNTPGAQIGVLVGQFRLRLYLQRLSHHALHDGLPRWNHRVFLPRRPSGSKDSPEIKFLQRHPSPRSARLAREERAQRGREASGDGSRNLHAAEELVLGFSALASFMVALDTQVLTAALATFGRFRAPMEALQWTVNASISARGAAAEGAALGGPCSDAAACSRRASRCSGSSIACALSTGISPDRSAPPRRAPAPRMVMPLGWAAEHAFPRKSGRARSASSAAVVELPCWPDPDWRRHHRGLDAMDILDQICDRPDRHHHGGKRGFAKVRARQPLSYSRLALVAAPHSRWFGAVARNAAGWSSAEVLTALAAGRCGGALSPGNGAPPRRWCRCDCSARGILIRNRRQLFLTERCTPCCFSCRSSCRPRSAMGRSAPA